MIIRRAIGASALAVLTLGVMAAPAAAVPNCQRMPKPRLILSGEGMLESVVADRQGRLYFDDISGERILKLGRQGGKPRTLVADVPGPGGLVFGKGGTLYAGFNAAQENGATAREAGLLRVNKRTGAHSIYVQGLEGANGVARGPDNELYTSNDFSTHIAKVANGKAEVEWGEVLTSPNGLVVDPAGQFLYAAQTFQPAAVARIPLATGGAATNWFSAPPADISAGLDGMTRDSRGRLYIAANGAGEVWRIDTDKQACVLWRGDRLGPSMVAFGHGADQSRFGWRNLYIVNFQGDLIELPHVRGRQSPRSG
jgi:sugar lactone lactonase YvrE